MLQFGIAPKPLRPRHQPQIELVFQVAHLAQQLGVVALRIVHQVARVNLEKLGQDLPRRIRQVRPRAALNLREITLAQLRPVSASIARTISCWLRSRSNPLAALNLAQVPDFLAQLHILV